MRLDSDPCRSLNFQSWQSSSVKSLKDCNDYSSPKLVEFLAALRNSYQQRLDENLLPCSLEKPHALKQLRCNVPSEESINTYFLVQSRRSVHLLQTSLGDLLVVISFSSHRVISTEKKRLPTMGCFASFDFLFFLVWELTSLVPPRKIVIQHKFIGWQ